MSGAYWKGAAIRFHVLMSAMDVESHASSDGAKCAETAA
jgi:hypothetical protein